MAHDGLEGMSKLFIEHPDLITLDVMLPGSNGFEVCRRIRQVSNTPIIILTALNDESEMLRGLEAGADDFLSKPFNPEILLARANAVMRRRETVGVPVVEGKNSSFEYNDGHLDINVERRYIMINGKRIKLTPIEFRLLVYLARNAGKALTFDQILSHVWGDEYRGSIEHVHVYISQLRRKLEEDTRSPHYIVTLRGVGYIFEKQELIYKS
jgi:DNA-binding response OmpR family regulator